MRRLASALETALFAARWLLAPFYVGLALALALLLGAFCVALAQAGMGLFAAPADKLAETAILMALSLVDLSLTASLLVIVILSGYENFVSRIAAASADARPSWMGAVDFAGLKMKVISSIVAISAVALLRNYLELADHPAQARTLVWQVALCLTFAALGVAMAAMDRIAADAPHRSG